MRQVDQNNAIKPVCGPVRAAACQYQAAALADEGLYFPVSSTDRTATRLGAQRFRAPAHRSAAACISLLIPGIGLSGRRQDSRGGDSREHGGLYFPVNSKPRPRAPQDLSAHADPRPPGGSL